MPLKHHNFTREETESAVEILQKAGLMRPIMSFRGEIRYSITNYELKDFMEKVYEMQQDFMSIIFSRWLMKEKPDREQRKQIEFFYGEKTSNMIINEWYSRIRSLGNTKDYLKSLQKEKRRNYINKIKKGIENSKKQLEEDQTRLYNRISELKKKYSKVLMDNGFDHEFINSLFFKGSYGET